MKKAIDASEFQVDIDWKKAKDDGVELAVLREGYGNNIDAEFLKHCKGAQSVGLPVQIYHFIYWHRCKVKDNAITTVANMKKACLPIDTTWVWVDLEKDSWVKAGQTPTRTQCSEYILAYIKALKALGVKKIGVYANCDYMENYLSEEVKSYPLWIADYDDHTDYTNAIMWQYTSTGRVNGIKGDVDMDIWYGEEEKKMGYTADQVLAIAKNEVGYKGKKSNSQLDDKYANAGGKYTKYARDLYQAGYYNGNKQSYDFCDVFYDWCHYQASGRDKALAEKTECQTGTLGAGCTFSAQYYREAGRFGTTPRKGAQIFYSWSCDKTDIDHTGIVESYDDTYVDTIEGNVLGGQVARKHQRRDNPYIIGYGYPLYADKAEKTTYQGDFPHLPVRGRFILGDTGSEVKKLQRLLNWFGSYGLDIDGSFGPLTLEAVKDCTIRLKATSKANKWYGTFGKVALKKIKAIKR